MDRDFIKLAFTGGNLFGFLTMCAGLCLIPFVVLVLEGFVS